MWREGRQYALSVVPAHALVRTVRACGRGRLTFGKELGHAVELALDAVQALSNADGIVEDGVFGVMGVGLLAGLCLVEAENIIDDLLLVRIGLACWQVACG